MDTAAESNMSCTEISNLPMGWLSLGLHVDPKHVPAYAILVFAAMELDSDYIAIIMHAIIYIYGFVVAW